MVGASPQFQRALAQIRKFAVCNATVLISGETGTGKELAARAIHVQSERRQQPFVPVNCGALPDSVVESELFGHIRGAFTDAREAKPGLISQARGGTLFLDEVEAMTPRVQVALLRFLQEKEYRPVGGAAVERADVRVVGATNASLALLVKQGVFRADLLFRLNVLPIDLPPLRERRGDVKLLACSFLKHFGAQAGRATPPVLSQASLARLDAYSWPGNVRELANLIQQHVVLSGDEPELEIWPPGCEQASELSAIFDPLENEAFRVAKARAVAQFEKSYLQRLLEKSAGNISLASRLSGKDRSDIGKLIRKYRLARERFTST